LTTVWLRFEIGIQTNYTVVHQPASICIFYGDKLFLVTGESYQIKDQEMPYILTAYYIRSFRHSKVMVFGAGWRALKK